MTITFLNNLHMNVNVVQFYIVISFFVFIA